MATKTFFKAPLFKFFHSKYEYKFKNTSNKKKNTAFNFWEDLSISLCFLTFYVKNSIHTFLSWEKNKHN